MRSPEKHLAVPVETQKVLDQNLDSRQKAACKFVKHHCPQMYIIAMLKTNGSPEVDGTKSGTVNYKLVVFCGVQLCSCFGHLSLF